MVYKAYQMGNILLMSLYVPLHHKYTVHNKYSIGLFRDGQKHKGDCESAFFYFTKANFCEISRKKVKDFQQNVCENLELLCKILKILFTLVCLAFFQESNPPRPLINSLKWVC